MPIGRKEAILALVATMIPWVGRRAGAQVTRIPPQELNLRGQVPDQSDLQRRVAALESQLANQVAFTRDASGNLQLRGNGNITLDAGANLTVRAGAQAQFSGGGTTSIRGSSIALN